MTDSPAPQPVVPPDFVVPLELNTPRFVLRPLGPEHNLADHRAWTASAAHILATPGFGPPHDWPPPDGLSPEENLKDLEAHQRDFQARTGFTYTVLDPTAADLDFGDPIAVDPTVANPVIGCVYIYGDETVPAEPTKPDRRAVRVRSWVVADRSELDRELWSAVSRWLESSWPFGSIRYAPRSG